MRDRTLLDFSVGIDLGLFLRRGQNRLRFCMRAENYLRLICRSKLAFFGVGIEIDLVIACGQKMTCFQRGDRLSHLVLVSASNLASFLSRWLKLTRFHCGGSNLT